IVRNSTIGPHINPTTPWQPWLSSGANRAVPAAFGDGGADGGALTPMVISAVLYTSADYYQFIGGGPSPAEPYLGEYGNTSGAAPTTDAATTADGGVDAPAVTDGGGSN